MVDLARSVGAKVRLRLVAPFIFLMFLASLDRANVSFAALRMNAELHLTPSQYGWAAGVFFIGFLAGQYPSVLLLGRVGVRVWLAIVLTAWGLAASALAFVHSSSELLVLRLVLGFAEAGLTPGIVLYLGGWSPARDRASTFALPMLAIPISLILGGPLSGWLLSAGSPLPMASWRWMFLAEGAPVLVMALLSFLYFPKAPSQARWLDAGEQAWIAEHSALSNDAARGTVKDILLVLGDGRVWGAAVMWFLLLSGSYAIQFWLPQVVRQMSHLGDFQIGLVSALPWIGNGLGVALNALHSDRTQERFWHFGAAALAAGAAFAAIGSAPTPLAALMLLVAGATAMGAAQGAFWAIPTALFPARAMAAGVTFVNMAGCAAGLVIPWMVGVIRQASGGFSAPIYLVAALLASSFVILCVLRFSRPGEASAFASPGAG
jgi:ACS family tartrate transporter-like MFS transporter